MLKSQERTRPNPTDGVELPPSVFRVLGATALVTLFVGLVIQFWAAEIAAALEPVALRFDGDGLIDEENRGLVLRSVRVVSLLLVAAATSLSAWLWAWQSLAARLPERASPPLPLVPVRREDVAVVALAVTCLAVLSYRQLFRGFGFDEIATVQSVVESPSWLDVFGRAVVFNNHIPFSALSRLCRLLLGTTEQVYRLPAFVLGLASVPTVWWMGRVWFDCTTARGAAILLATAPLMVQYTASARGYTGVLLFGMASTVLFLSACRSGSRWKVPAYIVCSAVAIWFHLYGAFVVVAHAGYLLWAALWKRGLERRRFRAMLIALPASALLAGVLYLPVMARLIVEAGRRGRSPFQADFPWVVALELSGGLWLVVAPVAWGLWTLKRAHPGTATLAVALLVPAIVVPWVMRPFDLYPRFFVFLLPIWLQLAAFSLLGGDRRGTVRRRRIGSALVLLIALIWGIRSWSGPEEEGFRSASMQITREASANTVLVGVGSGAELTSYYLGRPLAIAGTVDELEALVEHSSTAMVLHRRGTVDIRPHPITRFLSGKAKAMEHGNVTVYTWHRE